MRLWGRSLSLRLSSGKSCKGLSLPRFRFVSACIINQGQIKPSKRELFINAILKYCEVTENKVVLNNQEKGINICMWGGVGGDGDDECG